MITNEQILEQYEALNNNIVEKWLQEEFLSYQWFILVFIVLVCYVVFFLLVDKKRFSEILLFGSFVAVLFVIYDAIFSFFGFWAHLISILPVYPNFLIGDLALFPLIAMLAYQYTHSWGRFIIWDAIYSAAIVFVLYDWIFGALGIYTYLKPYAVVMDFALFLLVGIISRAVIMGIKNSEAKRGNPSAQEALSKLKP